MTYRPWAYAPKDYVQQRDVERFRAQAQEEQARSQEKPREIKKRNKSPFTRAASFAKELGKDAGGAALKAIDAPAEYVGEPIFGVVSGLNRAQVQVAPKTGQRYRKTASLWDAARSIGDAFTDPIGSYKEGRESTDEYFSDPNKSVALKIAGRAVADPLTYIGPGAVKGVARGSTAPAARWAAALLESPRAATGGAILGSAAAGEVAERMDAPDWVKAVAPLAGGVAGGAYGGKTGFKRVGLQLEDVSADQIKQQGAALRSAGLKRERMPAELPTAEVKVRPELFQGRDPDPGLYYSEARVSQIVDNWDPNRFEPGMVAHDASSGDYVVIAGHHRKRALEVQAERGLEGDSYPWYVIEADLTDPNHVAALQRYAHLSNYGTAATTLAEDVKAYKSAVARGVSPDDARREMRRGSVEGDDLRMIADLPEELGVVDAVSRQPAYLPAAAEIARAAKAYGFEAVDVQALWRRFGPRSRNQISDRLAFREVLDRQGRKYAADAAAAAQGTITKNAWGDTKSKVLTEIDESMARLKTANKAVTTARSAVNQAQKLAKADAEDALKEGRPPVDFGPSLASAQKRLDEAVRVRDETRAGFGQGAIKVSSPGLESAVESVKPALTGRVGQTVSDPQVGEWVNLGTVEAPQPVEIIAPGVGRRPWKAYGVPGDRIPVETGADMFGEAPSYKVVDPVPEPKPQVAAAPAIQQGFGGSVQELPGMSPPAVVQPAPAIQQVPGPGPKPPQPPGAASPPAKPLRPAKGSPAAGPWDYNAGPVANILRPRPRSEVFREGAKRAESWTSRVDVGLRRAFGKLSTDDDDLRRIVDPVLREKTRMEQNARHWVAWRRIQEEGVLRAHGLVMKMVDGVDGTKSAHLFEGSTDLGLFDDVVEQTSDAGKAAFDTLSPKQQTALKFIGATNTEVNGTVLQMGGKVYTDPEIQGDYFGRRAISRTSNTPEEIAKEGARVQHKLPQGSSRRVGAERTKTRVFESIEEAQKKGFEFENPWVTREAILLGKLRDGTDAYLIKEFKRTVAVPKSQFKSAVGMATIPGHPGFNQTWFRQDVAERIKKGLDSAPPPNIFQQVNNALTPLRASFDMSGTFQQGLRLWMTNPKAAAHYWWETMRSLKDKSIYERVLLAQDARARELGFMDGLGDLIAADLRFTGGMTTGEFNFSQGMVGRVKGATVVGKGLAKGFEASNAIFDRLLNLYRVEFALNQAERLKLVPNMTPADRQAALRQSMHGVNRAFGWTSSDPSTLEKALFFAPRYTRASLETLRYTFKPGIEGNMARKHLGLMAAEGAVLVGLTNELLGRETSWDPRDPNFLRFRDIGGLDVTPFGTYNTIFKAIAQGVAGTPDDWTPEPHKALKRFVEGKLNPAAGLVYWPLRGETYLGEPLTAGSPKELAHSAQELTTSSLPFGVQTLIKERDPLAFALGSTGLSNTPVTPSEKRDTARDRLARQLFDMKYDDLLTTAKSEINAMPDVAKNQAAADKNTLSRNTDRSAYVKASTGTAAKIEALGEELGSGAISGNQFRDQYRLLQAEMRGARSVLMLDDKGDKAVSGWFNLMDQATLPSGRIDYDELERLQAAFTQKNPGIEEKLLKAVGAKDTPILREYRAARAVAAQFYEIPAYRGMSLEESRAASRLLGIAQDMVSFGYEPSMKAALVGLMDADPSLEPAVRLALLAQKAGPNPERKIFRAEHPEMARFYSDIAAR